MSMFKKLSTKMSDSGFTTVEILVAIIVGALFVTSINTIYTTQVYMNERGRDLVVANSYVESKIEALRSAGYLSLADGTTDITSELPDELNQADGSLVISSYNTAIKQVVLTINYNQQGNDQSYAYTTYMGELGVGQY